MKPETIDAIHDATLKARELMTTEISEQLEGIYGLLPSGQFNPVAEYPALGSIPEAAETRRRLETHLADEQQAGLTAQQAREKLVKEAAFTWLNRFVAFKMMETRRLLRQTVTRGQESNGFKMWLTEPGNDEHYRDYGAGDLPQDGLGEGPRQRAYRCFLLAQCARLAQEVRVLFDSDNLASRLCPRPQALHELIDLLNDDQLQEAWQPGSEETIGWVYQAFNAEELEHAFREVRLSKKKFEASDIPSVTQLFTPRWIVRFLVENALGRLWMNMHPDSQLGAKLEYLVPEDGRRTIPLKSVREITLLDPACGTMHFGLVAFDLFVEMYREEMANAGKPGWPQKPPLDEEEQIPSAIVAHNLHGIDIDLRAVQLSALTLYLKAKTLNPKATLRESRLACADIHMLDGSRLQEFLAQARLHERPIYGRVLEALQHRLKDAEQLGSLLRLDEEIRGLVEQERQRYEREGRQLDFPGWSLQQFETEAGRREFWEILEIQIGQALDAFARERAATGQDHSFFAGETTKGLQLLEIMSGRYDVVVTNPPYMSARKMNSTLKRLVSDAYPAGKGDLYAAFIQRCLEFTGQHGRVGMLTMHSFMFISSYERLRSYLRERVCIDTLAHLGPGLFAVGNPGTLQTAAYVLSRESNAQTRNDSVGTYFRLVKEPDGEAKRLRFEQALPNLGSSQPDPAVYLYRQADFDYLPRKPWCYWTTSFEYQMFANSENLSTLFEIDMGLKTSNNFRFVRWWWEIGKGNIASAESLEEAKNSAKKWFPYAKGGKNIAYSSDVNHVVNWKNDGLELKAFFLGQYPYLNGKTEWCTHNVDLYFRPGVVWSPVSSYGLQCRRIPPGAISSNGSYGIFAQHEYVPNLLAFMNSAVGRYLARILCPTINHNKGDIALLPVPCRLLTDKRLQELGEHAVSVVSSCEEYDETSPSFTAPPKTTNSLDFDPLSTRIDDYLFSLLGIGDKQAFIKEFLEMPLDSSNEEPDELNDSDNYENSELDETTPSEIQSRAISWISYAVGIAMGRFLPGIDGALGRGHFSEDTAAKLRALAGSDGILVLDQGNPDDLATKVLQALQLMLGQDAAAEVVAEATRRTENLEEELRSYLEHSFFKEHLGKKKYRKRPVYWLLQSPRKTYSVWIFHEKLTKDTLYRIIRRDEYVALKIRLLETNIADLHRQHETAQGRQRRALKKQMAELNDMLDDLRAFAERIDAILQRGYTPHIDDGVLINMAPLWELMPSWQAEPKKCWDALARGDYDWSHQAMDHWPERVRKKCQTNKSYAIAHGLA